MPPIGPLVIFVMLCVFGWSLGRVFGRTGHGVALVVLPILAPFALLALFIGLPFADIEITDDLGIALVAGLFVLWLLLLVVLAFKKWPADRKTPAEVPRQ